MSIDKNISLGPPQGRLNSVVLHAVGYLAAKSQTKKWQARTWGVGIVWKGEGWYRALPSEQSVRLSGPSFFYVWPNGRFEYGPDTQWEESYLLFSGERCVEWERYGWLRRLNQVYSICESTFELKRLHSIIYDRADSGGSENEDLAKAMVEQLICQLNIGLRNDASIQPFARRIVNIARRWRQEPWLTTDIRLAAEQAEMSYPHFRKKFRELIGQPPYQYLAAQRISHACRLLSSTRLSIKEIAYQCGFEYVESFNRLFKQQMKQSPKYYRQSQYPKNF